MNASKAAPEFDVRTVKHNIFELCLHIDRISTVVRGGHEAEAQQYRAMHCCDKRTEKATGDRRKAHICCPSTGSIRWSLMAGDPATRSVFDRCKSGRGTASQMGLDLRRRVTRRRLRPPSQGLQSSRPRRTRRWSSRASAAVASGLVAIGCSKLTIDPRQDPRPRTRWR